VQLILMKNGGNVIYSGPIGEQSCKVIEYFEVVLLEMISDGVSIIYCTSFLSFFNSTNIKFA
jgi:hypothetical protein